MLCSAVIPVRLSDDSISFETNVPKFTVLGVFKLAAGNMYSDNLAEMSREAHFAVGYGGKKCIDVLSSVPHVRFNTFCIAVPNQACRLGCLG